MEKKTIRSFKDLIVYQNLYHAMLLVLRNIIPRLPREERFDLVDQMRRCCKASPALIAEGFAKRYQLKNWKKYLDDTIGECNEMIHHLTVCQDVYSDNVDEKTINELIEIYDLTNRQLYRLGKSWQNFHDRNDS